MFAMERDQHFRAGGALAHKRRRGAVRGAALAALGGLGLWSTSAFAQTQDLTLSDTITLSTNSTTTGVVFQAFNNIVDINENGFNLTLTQGRLTKNGTFSSTIRGGRLISSNGRLDIAL